MIGVAPDDCPEGNQGVETAALRQTLQRQRNLQRAGHSSDLNGLSGNTQPFQFSYTGNQQTLASVGVEAAHHDADGQVFTVECAGVFVDIVETGHGEVQKTKR